MTSAATGSVVSRSGSVHSLEERLVGLFRQCLELEDVGPDDHFLDLGGDSIRAARLFTEIHRQLGLDLPLDTILRAPTPRELAAALHVGAAPNPDLVVALRTTESDAPPLFVVHGIYGDIVAAANLADRLSSPRSVYAIRAQSLDGRPARFRDVPAIAAHYVDRIRQVRPEGPYLLFGYSFGGAVAYEMAHQLRYSGQEVGFLGLGDTHAPTRRVPEGTMTGNGPVRSRIRNRREVALRFQDVGGLVAASVGRVTGRLPRRLRGHYLLRLHRIALWSYRPPRYDGRVVLFRAESASSPPDREWGGLVPRLQVVGVPSGHLDLMKPPAVEHLAARLDAVLPETTDEI